MLTFAWHAALYTCAVYGAVALTVTFGLLALICLKARRLGKRRQAAARVVAGAEALLKDAAR